MVLKNRRAQVVGSNRSNSTITRH